MISDNPRAIVKGSEALEAMKEFAKLHCIEQARVISEKATTEPIYVPSCDDHTPYWGPCVSCGNYDNDDVLVGEKIDKDSILNSYPLTNIK